MNKTFLKLDILIVVLFVTCVSLVGCNTIEGAGEDVEDLGESIQDTAD